MTRREDETDGEEWANRQAPRHYGQPSDEPSPRSYGAGEPPRSPGRQAPRPPAQPWSPVAGGGSAQDAGRGRGADPRSGPVRYDETPVLPGPRAERATPSRIPGPSGLPPARPPRRGRGRRIVKVTSLCLALLLVAAIALGVTGYFKINGNISTFSEAGASTQRPAAGPGENILLIGSDTRAGGNSSLGGGPVAGARSDTTILLHVYANHKSAVGVSIPRDTLVTIPPCQLPNGQWTQTQYDTMFNAAFAVGDSTQGNPVCTQNTVERLTGIRVDHTVVIDFSGFAAMTDAIGGVRVCVPNTVNSYGIHLQQGYQTVKGQTALDYVRVRHGLGDGSDIGRMKRQQAFMTSLLHKVLDSDALYNPISLYQFTDAASKSVTVDPGLGSAARMLSLGWSLHSLSMSNIKFLTMPWAFDGARVAIQQPAADQLWHQLAADQPVSGGSSSSAAGAPTGGGTSHSDTLTSLDTPHTASSQSPCPSLASDSSS